VAIKEVNALARVPFGIEYLNNKEANNSIKIADFFVRKILREREGGTLASPAGNGHHPYRSSVSASRISRTASAR
jgi:hypothetical protein